MIIEKALVTHLTEDAPLTALVGTRIYPLQIPQAATLPAIAYQRIDTVRWMAHDGPVGMAYPRFQFTITASTYASARATANALRAALDGSVGTWGTLRIRDARILTEQDGYAPESEATVGLYTVRMDARIMHRED